MCVALLSKWKLEQHAFFKLSGNLVQLKDGACEGKTLTGVRERVNPSQAVFLFLKCSSSIWKPYWLSGRSCLNADGSGKRGSLLSLASTRLFADDGKCVLL